MPLSLESLSSKHQLTAQRRTETGLECRRVWDREGVKGRGRKKEKGKGGGEGKEWKRCGRWEKGLQMGDGRRDMGGED